MHDLSKSSQTNTTWVLFEVGIVVKEDLFQIISVEKVKQKITKHVKERLM